MTRARCVHRHELRRLPPIYQGGCAESGAVRPILGSTQSPPYKEKWEKITDEDIAEIQRDMVKFGTVLQKRYGELQKEEVSTWAHRRYCHWIGNYTGYKDPEPKG